MTIKLPDYQVCKIASFSNKRGRTRCGLALLSWLFLLNFPILLFAQPAPEDFKKIPIEANGIPYHQFFAIVQDQEGFLWLSTNRELLKYDGYEVKVYRHHPEDTTSLGNNSVVTLFADTNDLGQPNQFIHNDFSTLFEDRQGQLWLGAGTGGGLFKKDIYSPRFTWFPSLKRAQRSCESKIFPGTFWTNYKFEAKFEGCSEDGFFLGAEIFGRCQHPIEDGSGTGVFAGVKGRLDFKDEVETGEFPYRGNLNY